MDSEDEEDEKDNNEGDLKRDYDRDTYTFYLLYLCAFLYICMYL
jgi:hypothetical protein